MDSSNSEEVFDFVIVGSGFGGSVSAMRLAQKGYSVALLEMGKRYRNSDFPKTNWNIFKYLWAPLLRCFGIQKITLLKKVMVLHGVGVGGGSLVYANTLMKPEDKIFQSSMWPEGRNWAQEMAPFYATAKKMLGVTTNPILREGEMALKEVGEKLGVGDTYHPTEVGIFFGEENKKVSDPYFSGEGPDRVGCNACGACMIGCPNGAKNTLDKNYLYFAEKWGVKIFPETKVTKIQPVNRGDVKYEIGTQVSTSMWGKKGRTFQARNVILSAGVLGTVDILLKNKLQYKTLTNVSSNLGMIVRTNNESLLGATTFDKTRDMSDGIAIGAAIQADEHTKIEGVRYPKKSDLMRFLAVPLTGDGNVIVRPLKLLGNFIFKFPSYLRLLLVRDWAKSSLILLVMQSIETKMRLTLGRSVFSLFRKGVQGKAEPGEIVPSYLPVAQKAGEELAKSLNGVAQNVASEVILGTPATAHILGGAIMGKDEKTGVISDRHEVFGHPGLYVCDASVIPTNLAVNPSLTITALAERFAALFPDHPQRNKENQPTIKFSGE